MTVVFLGEEVGWRGFLLPRLDAAMPLRRAALLTGAAHAVFRLPLRLLTTTYQSAGSRWIVVPTVMGTLTLAGIVDAWLCRGSGSIWPVSSAHTTFNLSMDAFGTAAAPAALAYVTTETGVATLAIMIVLAAVFLSKRASRCERDGW